MIIDDYEKGVIVSDTHELKFHVDYCTLIFGGIEVERVFTEEGIPIYAIVRTPSKPCESVLLLPENGKTNE